MAKNEYVKSTTGTVYRLSGLLMQGLRRGSNRVSRYGHCALRGDVRQAFLNSNHVMLRTSYNHGRGLAEYLIRRDTPNQIAFGCQRFRGPNYRKLKKWALHQ